MAKRVLVHRADSIYDDRPDTQYQFPSQYLSRMKPCEGDWIVYYEPRKGGGRLGYNAIAKVQEIISDPSKAGMYLAVIEAGSFLPLEQFVPYQVSNTFYESDLDAGDGSLIQGKMQSAVRPISDDDFLKILQAGIPSSHSVLPRQDEQTGFAEPGQDFAFETERPVVEQLITRKVRDRVFRTKVLQAYDSRCAIT
ncbi:MAG: restriction endonuclease, partial [Pseudomonadota bacterium]